MYCQHCGAQLAPGATACARCAHAAPSAAVPPQGFPPQGYPQPYAYPYAYRQPPGMNALALTGFILSFFVPVVGLALCIAGLAQCNRTGEQGRGLAIAGIAVNVAGIVLLLTIAAAVAAFAASFDFSVLPWEWDWGEEFPYAYTALACLLNA